MSHVRSQRVDHVAGTRSYNQQLLLPVYDRLQNVLYREYVTYLLVGHHNVHVLHYALLLLHIVHEQPTGVPTVYLDPVCNLAVGLISLRVLDRNDPLPADLIIRVSDNSAQLLIIISRYRGNILKRLAAHLLAHLLKALNHTIDNSVHVTQNLRRVVPLRDELVAPCDHSLRQHNRCGSTVTCTGSSPVGCLLHHTHRQVLDWILKVYRFCNRHTVLGHGYSVHVVL